MWMERELKDSAKNLFVQIVRESCQKCVAPKDTHTPPTNSFWFEPPRLSLQTTKCYNLMNEHNIIQTRKWIDGFRCIKIQPNKTDLNTKLWGIITEFVGFIPQSLVLRPGGQDEQNPELYLANRAGKMVLSCLVYGAINSKAVHKHTKKELGQYPATLTSCLVNNSYILPYQDYPLFLEREWHSI